MSHPHYHAVSSARRFGGKPDDYIAIHSWFDATKEAWADTRHRALRHHSFGIFECERQFGVTIKNSSGKDVPVRLIGEQHVIEDCGFIPTLQDWFDDLPRKDWMVRGATPVSKVLDRAERAGTDPVAELPALPAAPPPPADFHGLHRGRTDIVMDEANRSRHPFPTIGIAGLVDKSGTP
jgi:hypothetical protein